MKRNKYIIVSLVICLFACQGKKSQSSVIMEDSTMIAVYQKPIVEAAKKNGLECITNYLAKLASPKGMDMPSIKNMKPIFVVDSVCVLSFVIDVLSEENEGEYFYLINSDGSISEALHQKGALYHLIGSRLNRGDSNDFWGEHKASTYDKYKKEFSSSRTWEDLYNGKYDSLMIGYGGFKRSLLHGFERMKERGKIFDEFH